MKKPFALLAGVLVVLGMNSCAPSSPGARIERDPQAFARLSERDKQLVSRGEIAKGMGHEAVLIAWGAPASKSEGLRRGQASERWDYAGSRPVYNTNLFAGYGFGRLGPYGYSGYGLGMGPEVTYLPYTRASVWFIGGRVDEWERQRR